MNWMLLVNIIIVAFCLGLPVVLLGLAVWSIVRYIRQRNPEQKE